MSIGKLNDFISRRVNELSSFIDKSFDQPGAGNPVNLRAFTGDPFHVAEFNNKLGREG